MLKGFRISPGRKCIVLSLIVVLFLFGWNQFTTVMQLKRNLIHIEAMKHAYHDISETKSNTTFRTPFRAQSDDEEGHLCQSRTTVFQSPEAEEFPSSNNSSPRIPHNIHQICDSELVLDVFVEPMQSFVVNNPSWEYWFWTYESGRRLLENEYPYLLDMFDGFGKELAKKADLLRYAIIHKFGGMYADLDVRNLRPLDKASMKYACIVPTEPFEHSALMYNRSFVLSQAVLLCRPRHPLFTHLLLNLQLVRSDMGPVQSTGPLYITNVFLLYNNLTDVLASEMKTDDSTNSPYFYKGTRPETDEDAVYIPNSQYFMDMVAPDIVMNGKLKPCGYHISGAYYKVYHTDPRYRRGCNEFDCRKNVRKSKTFAFTVHHWYHMWISSDKWKNTQKKVHVDSIFKNYKMY